jgi:hypothetical protein
MGYASSLNQIFLDIDQGNLSNVEKAVKDGIDVNYSNEFGETLLMRAANNKHFHIVKLLISARANVNIKDKYGFTVVDILESNIRRAGINRDQVVETMRHQGLTEDSIKNMLGEPNGKAKGFTEDDRKMWQEILDYIHKLK